MSIYDYTEAEFRTFALWAIMPDGACECGDPDCMAIGKHPRVSSWQHSPVWSDEQIEIMEETGQISTGYGVCLDDHIVLDIDKRNGGFESYDKLKSDTGIDYEKESGFVVATGGGGLHIYFSAPAGVSLVAHLKSYSGIDFKSSGYLVGYGSMHKSGIEYERKKGFPQDLTLAPEALIKLLKRPDRIRAHVGGSDYIETSEGEIAAMLAHIDPDCDYDQWIACGMAIHEATQGAGEHLWDAWSATGSKYDAEVISRHWQSFGKCSNPVTLGTLIHYAEEAGWQQPVTFDDVPPELETKNDDEPFDTASVDILRPPGFVGELTAWINDQCRYSRERLSVAAAISSVGSIGGMRHTDEYNDITANTLMLCVAASGTGKEAVQQAQAEILRAAGMASAVHGAIKSEQEITRNVIRHQAAIYIIDEFGYVLQKIENARKRGGAAYLDGVVAALMSIYTKANGFYLVGGDLKDELKKSIIAEISQLDHRIGKGEDQRGEMQAKMDRLIREALPAIEKGIENPFLGLIGYTTPATFNDLVTGEQATNGFIARCMLMQEHETNPRRKRGFKKRPMPPEMAATLQIIHCGGVECVTDTQRVEWTGRKMNVPTTGKAADMLEAAADWFEEEAERQKGQTGLEAIVRRSYELMAKISFILAIPGGLRDAEHVRYAYKLAVCDMRAKLRLAYTNVLGESKDATDASTALMMRIKDICGGDGETMSVIVRRSGRKYAPSDIEAIITQMVASGHVEQVEYRPEGRGRPSVRYRTK